MYPGLRVLKIATGECSAAIRRAGRSEGECNGRAAAVLGPDTQAHTVSDETAVVLSVTCRRFGLHVTDNTAVAGRNGQTCPQGVTQA